MFIRNLVTGILDVYLLLGIVNSESCDRKSTCSCECSQGVVDLKALGTKDGPRYKDVYAIDNFKYSYNPCDPFSETWPGTEQDTCQDVASCKLYDQTGVPVYYDAGTQDSVTFYTELGKNVGLADVDTDVVVAKYTSRDAERQTEVILVCNDLDSNTEFDSLGEITNSPSTYRFILVSPECCFIAPGLSIGSILLIVAVSLLGAYLIVGVPVKKLVYHASGVELIPNTAFWTALPSLITDGFFCVLRRKRVYNAVR